MQTENNKGDPLVFQSEASGAANAKGKKPEHPATQTQKIILSVFLVVLTAISLLNIYDTIDRINKESLAEVSTPWILPDGIVLKDGPVGFHYEAAEGKLIHSGPITAARKLTLRDLLEAGLAITPPSSSGRSGSTDKPNAQQKSHDPDAASSTKKAAVNLEDAHKS